MAQSRLIELSYFDPHTSIRLTTYADTIVTDYSSPNRIISAVRFGGSRGSKGNVGRDLRRSNHRRMFKR